MRSSGYVMRVGLVTGVFAVSACNASALAAPAEQVDADAVVRYMSFEGGFYAIETVAGRHFDPLNLPAGFRQDGIAVHVTGVVRADLASAHLYGELLDIRSLTRRGTAP